MHQSLRFASAAAITILIAGCGKPAEQTTTVENSTTVTETTSVAPVEPTPVMPSPTPSATATGTAKALTGRWTGVEGMFLNVADGATPGTYKLTMQWDLDHKGSFDGTADGDGIAFERDGKREVLKPSDGDATGLKYLAGKTDCLTVKSGEGYCRA